jgi:hypothetical protein
LILLVRFVRVVTCWKVCLKYFPTLLSSSRLPHFCTVYETNPNILSLIPKFAVMRALNDLSARYLICEILTF